MYQMFLAEKPLRPVKSFMISIANLIKNIREAVEYHFDVPYQNVEIKIKGIY